ncbi:MAG: tRNA (adenosine(37)-N6)-threonylcarbamoyltransferase complex dimerization subunit type 1 TsaB [bacterium]|nr:tRNA (adenosine(37)-N6)-threonylcarbamoyltransferase complex dimerization subunit type 1 TsaB [bacterium]
MKVLALESATLVGSVALLDGESATEKILDVSLHHSEKLLPAIISLLEETGNSLQQIDLLACDAGPGSFTGLRVGLALMKGLAYGNKKPLLTVSSLEVLAMNATSPSSIVPMINAYRGEIYTAVYQDGKQVVEEQVIGPEAFLKSLEKSPSGLCFLGDGALHYRSLIETVMGDKASFGDDPVIHAAHLGRIALKRFQQGENPSLFELAPRYLRAGV